MTAKIAVYIASLLGFGVTEHDCSDLARTLGTDPRWLCDGCHQRDEELGQERIGQDKTSRHRMKLSGAAGRALRDELRTQLANGLEETLQIVWLAKNREAFANG